MVINKDNSRSTAAAELRRHAEEQLKAKPPEKGYSGEDEATQKLHYELQVHQIELEMQNAELRRSRDELEAANIELEAFNYSVSHDLRTPLTAINSYCQVIKELCGNRLDDVCHGYIREIYEGTLRLNKLIETLLDFSRMKHVEICNERVDLSALARSVAAELILAEPERTVKFQCMAGITVDGDAALLRIVLNNLMGNAWKYTADEAEPVIEFGKTELDGKPACFVRDNGPGFDMSRADRLFIPFQRLPGTSVDGNGIGLATVERIVKRHGGRVWAESEPGKGATFVFTLE